MKRLKKPSGRQGRLARAGLLAKRLLLVVALALPLLLGLLIWLAFFTDMCDIEEVTISGNSYLSAERVRELSGVDSYENLVTLPVGRIADNLENEPWVKEARIGRTLPGTVLIGIVERKPLALVDCCGVGFLVDDTGYVISGASREEFTAIPIINASDAAPPEVGGIVSDGGVRTGVKVLASMSGVMRSSLLEVETSDDGALVFASRDGFAILYGDAAQIEKKNDVLAAVIEDVRRNARLIEYLDVRVPDSPVIMPR